MPNAPSRSRAATRVSITQVPAAPKASSAFPEKPTAVSASVPAATLSLLSPALPAAWNPDGSLDEWAPLRPANGDWIAIVMTSEGLVLSGAVSLPEFRLQITMPRMNLPEWATYLGRAGEYARFGCEDLPWPGEELKPKEVEACRTIAAQYANLESTYKAQFITTYLVDEHCIHIPDSTAATATIGARPGVCKLANGKLTFETTMANQSLPVLGQAPMTELEATVWSSAPGATTPILQQSLKLPKPVDVGPSAKLMALIFEHLQSAKAHAQPEAAFPALTYRADGTDAVRVYALPGWTGPSPVLMTRVDPKRVTFHDFDLSKPGVGLGRVEVRFLPSELAGALVLLDAKPLKVLPVYPHHVVLKRDRELQLLSWDFGTEDSTMRGEVVFFFQRIDANGEVSDAQEWTTLEWNSSHEFHDAAFNRVGVLSGLRKGPRRIEWQYVSKKRRYVRIGALDSDADE